MSVTRVPRHPSEPRSGTSAYPSNGYRGGHRCPCLREGLFPGQIRVLFLTNGSLSIRVLQWFFTGSYGFLGPSCLMGIVLDVERGQDHVLCSTGCVRSMTVGSMVRSWVEVGRRVMDMDYFAPVLVVLCGMRLVMPVCLWTALGLFSMEWVLEGCVS